MAFHKAHQFGGLQHAQVNHSEAGIPGRERERSLSGEDLCLSLSLPGNLSAETERDTQRETQRERQRERDTEGERQRERDRDRERQRDRVRGRGLISRWRAEAVVVILERVETLAADRIEIFVVLPQAGITTMHNIIMHNIIMHNIIMHNIIMHNIIMHTIIMHNNVQYNNAQYNNAQ